MHLTAINDKIRQTVFGLDYRGHLPADLLFHYDHVAKYAQKYYDDYRSQITELDQTFTSVAKALVLVLITQHYILPAWRQLWAVGPIGSLVAVYTAIRDYFIGIFLRLPFVSSKVASELADLRKDLSAKVAPKTFADGISLTTVRSLPEKGRDRAWLEEEWKNLKLLERGDVDDGRVSGAVYHGGKELTEIINVAMAQFTVSNPLHPDIFPGVRKMEAEIVSMCLELFHGPQGAGTTTSGGTESILMSVKAHRDWARETKGITKPEMVIPSSAHAAFWKACEYFKIKLHVVPVNEDTRQADVKRMARAMNSNTIMIVGSAPNFPDGAVDPIIALGKLAKRNNIGLHVDCCLGSFIMPFLNRAGFVGDVEPFDFAVEGVTAISCDIHKYAFCPKGSSVIMYHSPELRRYQYYVITDWAGGVYASPSMAGSRPGSILAGAWAVMNHVGADGYTSACQSIVSAARVFSTEVRHRFPDDLYVLGDPKVSVVAFGSKTLNVYALGDRMSKRGWHLNALQNPPALHMAFTRLTAMSVEKLLEDLAQGIAEVKAAKEAKGDEGQMVALYGMGQTSVGPYVVGKAAEIFLDVLYE